MKLDIIDCSYTVLKHSDQFPIHKQHIEYWIYKDRSESIKTSKTFTSTMSLRTSL